MGEPVEIFSDVMQSGPGAVTRFPSTKGKYGGSLISDLTHWEASFRTGRHDLVLGDVGADIKHHSWSLHGVSPLTKLRGAGVDHAGMSLHSNRRS
jgi:hypothetical protein